MLSSSVSVRETKVYASQDPPRFARVEGGCAKALERAAALGRAGPAVERQRREAVGQAVAGSHDVERLTAGQREAVHRTAVQSAHES
jgi:hypothetical protein